jgi:hypothetical protein
LMIPRRRRTTGRSGEGAPGMGGNCNLCRGGRCAENHGRHPPAARYRTSAGWRDFEPFFRTFCDIHLTGPTVPNRQDERRGMR